jgi:hypothetical protein
MFLRTFFSENDSVRETKIVLRKKYSESDNISNAEATT